jgi:hypothetical protein
MVFLGEKQKGAGIMAEKTGAVLHGDDAEARSEAARALGSVRSERKAEASRQNATLGGRPKGMKMSEESRRKQSEAAREMWARRKAEKNGETK